MNRADPQPLTPGDRDRALARLGRVTAGTGIGALVAVGGFSYVAAASYSGKHATATTGTALVTTATTAASASAAASTPTPAATLAPTAAPTAAPTPAPVATSGGS